MFDIEPNSSSPCLFSYLKTLYGLASPGLSMADYGYPTCVVPWVKTCRGDSSFIVTGPRV